MNNWHNETIARFKTPPTRWEIMFHWHDKPNNPPSFAIVSDDPLSIDDDTVMYTLDADEVEGGIVGDYLDFRIIKATEEGRE